MSPIFNFRKSTQHWQTMPGIYKRAGIFLPKLVECTPVVWQDRLITISFIRENSHGTGIVLHDYFTRSQIVQIPWNYGLGSAIIIENELFVFGSADWSRQNRIVMAQINSEYQIVNEHIIFVAKNGQKIFNTSVTTGITGYIMAYEGSEPGLVDFSIRFLKSLDFHTWEPIGDLYGPKFYAACPTIRLVDDLYYIFHLRHVNGLYVTFLTRTKDFYLFEDFVSNGSWPPHTQVLTSVGYPEEGINNSDLDLVEHKGMIYFMYADGDQKTWANLRTAIYFGTLKQFVHEFWP